MSNIKLATNFDSPELEAAIEQVVHGDSDNFFELAQTLGLNPLTDFEGSDLSFISLEPGSDLSRANLCSTNLAGASLQGVWLAEADLRNANLEGANLEGANLRNANLESANLEGANLRNANLESANLKGANFSKADLSGAITTPETDLDSKWRAIAYRQPVPTLYTADEALKFVEALLSEQGKRLNDLQRVMFRGAWDGKSSRKIYQECSSRCSYQHLIQNVGPELWRLVSDAVGDRVSKQNLQEQIERAREALLQLGASILPHGSELLPSYAQVMGDLEAGLLWNDPKPKKEDWDNAPEVSSVFGRDKDVQTLEEGIIVDGCRLVVLFGTPGIGKTTLAAKLAHKIKSQFDYFIWRSLERPPTLQALTADLVQFLSDGEETSTDLSRLLYYLRNQPCLIVLDGLETVLRSGVHNGAYQEGYEDYGELLKRVGQTAHQSCLILTSWEKPKEIARMEGESQRVFALQLEGLGDLAAREFLAAKGAFSCTESDWRLIARRYEGNPSALNNIATNVREVFGGNAENFLEQLQSRTPLFEDIRSLLDRQFNRLSDSERGIVECLANYQDPLTIPEILQSVARPISSVEAQEALQSLSRRAMIESVEGKYSLPTLFAEYTAELHGSESMQ